MKTTRALIALGTLLIGPAAAAQSAPRSTGSCAAGCADAPRRARAARGGGPSGGWLDPLLSGALELGAGGFTDGFYPREGLGGATYFGPSWGARASVDLFPFLGVDARYLGMWNHGVAATTGSDAGVVTSAGLATLRLIAPLPYAQPYVFSGLGLYGLSVVGNSQDRQASSLRTGVAVGVPIGVGVNVPITRHVSVGGEASFHYLIHESFATRPEIGRGDPVVLNGLVRFHL